MKIAVIGAGTIGTAIIESLLNRKFEGKIIATRRRIEKLRNLAEKGVKIMRNNKEIREEIKGDLVISLAAAVPLEYLKKIAPEARFIRAMPNVAVLVQESFTAFCCDKDVTEQDKELAKKIFKAMGVYWEVDEKYMDAVTGLSGSGPAYIAILIEALMYAGLKVGLPRDLAFHSAIQTVLGTAKLALQVKKHIAELKDMVVTPGGVTIEGIYELEDSRIRTAIMRAVEAATEKSKKITTNLLNNLEERSG